MPDTTKRALVSVSDKQGLIPFVKELVQMGYEILSTGGTAKTLQEAGIPVKAVSEFTGSPEILDGRVKTLHPKIHAGLLNRRNNPDHQKQMQEYQLENIDVVVVNLYPFEETISKPGVSLETCIENIDIGGPSMLRSAAKNFESVTVIANPVRYESVLAEMKSHNGDTTYETRAILAGEVYSHTAYYDSLIAQYFRTNVNKLTEYPEKLPLGFKKVQSMRYGENPHQSAAFYKSTNKVHPSLADLKQLQGKELSFNNLFDMDAALQCVMEFETPACVIVKHANPCGVALGKDTLDAYLRALEADPVSAFGGIVAINTTLDEAAAEKMSKKFLEVIIAPEITEGAAQILSAKENLRVVLTGNWTLGNKPSESTLRYVLGGLLIQDCDSALWDESKLQVVTKVQPTSEQRNDLKFAWTIVKYLKSNAISIAKDNVTLGLGMGQTNRVDAARHAITRAGDKVMGAVMASDAYFPYNDTVLEAAKAGIKAIIQPGGSKKDQDSIDACNEHGIAMVFTGMRHFRH